MEIAQCVELTSTVTIFGNRSWLTKAWKNLLLNVLTDFLWLTKIFETFFFFFQWRNIFSSACFEICCFVCFLLRFVLFLFIYFCVSLSCFIFVCTCCVMLFCFVFVYFVSCLFVLFCFVFAFILPSFYFFVYHHSCRNWIRNSVLLADHDIQIYMFFLSYFLSSSVKFLLNHVNFITSFI